MLSPEKRRHLLVIARLLLVRENPTCVISPRDSRDNTLIMAQPFANAFVYVVNKAGVVDSQTHHVVIVLDARGRPAKVLPQSPQRRRDQIGVIAVLAETLIGEHASARRAFESGPDDISIV